MRTVPYRLAWRSCGSTHAFACVCRDELSAMHAELLQQASTALSATEKSVDWLKEERKEAAAAGLRTVPGLPPIDAPLTGTPRGICGCFPRVRTCTIL